MSQYVPTYDSFSNLSSDRYVPTDRFQVMNSVYLPASEVDPSTGLLKPERQRRCRTQGLKMEIERLDHEEKKLQSDLEREMSKGGVRISMRLGLLLMVGLLVFCGFYLLIQQGMIAQRQKDVNRLERSIADFKTVNGDLREQLAKASSYEVVCYAASQNLGMIPASTSAAIHLVAVDTRPMEHTGQPVQQQELLNVQMTAEATAVPVIASN